MKNLSTRKPICVCNKSVSSTVNVDYCHHSYRLTLKVFLHLWTCNFKPIFLSKQNLQWQSIVAFVSFHSVLIYHSRPFLLSPFLTYFPYLKNINTYTRSKPNNTATNKDPWILSLWMPCPLGRPHPSSIKSDQKNTQDHKTKNSQWPIIHTTWHYKIRLSAYGRYPTNKTIAHKGFQRTIHSLLAIQSSTVETRQHVPYTVACLLLLSSLLRHVSQCLF